MSQRQIVFEMNLHWNSVAIDSDWFEENGLTEANQSDFQSLKLKK